MVDTVAVIANALATSQTGSLEETDDESAANDCSAHPEALSIVPFGSEGADCNGEDEKAISKEENRP